MHLRVREGDGPRMQRNRRIGSATRLTPVSRDRAHSDVVPLHAFRTPEDTMTETTDHYLGIDIHKRNAQVAVLDDEGTVVEEIRVANADLDEIAEKYAGSRDAIEGGSNYFTE